MKQSDLDRHLEEKANYARYGHPDGPINDCQGTRWPDCDCEGCRNSCPECGAELESKTYGVKHDEYIRVCPECEYKEF